MKIGFSSCPNDTYIFHAMMHSLVDTEGLSFEPYIADVEELNRLALAGELPVTKLSFNAWLHLRDTYTLLDAGSALGFGCGPLFIAGDSEKTLREMSIAVPGEYTTAHLLLKLWAPEAKNITHLRFDQVMPEVAKGSYDGGVIIHEGRFVYKRFKLRQIIDLGEWWEETTGMPIPLGCIAMRKDIEKEISPETMSSIIRSSIEYARNNPEASKGYIKSFAQEMDDSTIGQHIELYVNDFSLSLGEKGREAVNVLERMAEEKGVFN